VRLSKLGSTLALIAIVVAVAGGPHLLATSSPLWPQDYSATTVTTVEGGHTLSAKIYKRGLKMRMEPQTPGRSAGMYQILLLDQHKVYMVMPQAHMCMEQDMPALTQAQLLAAAQTGKGVVVTDVGAQTITVAGKSYACEHKRVASTTTNGTRYVVDVWLASALHEFPVQEVMQAQGKTVRIQYENVSLAAPAASLFVPPTNCHGMPGLGGMLGRRVP